ncbi:MAG: hypothetical protein WA142_07300 [Rugosibacter sp.]
MTTTPLTPLSCYILTHNSERRLAQVLPPIQQMSVAQLDAPARQTLGQAAQKFAQTHLSEEVMNQKLALFYEKIASECSYSKSI